MIFALEKMSLEELQALEKEFQRKLGGVQEELRSRVLNNKTAQSGMDRCDCGCKYWENDRCTDCGAEHNPVKHWEVEGVCGWRYLDLESEDAIRHDGEVRVRKTGRTGKYTVMQWLSRSRSWVSLCKPGANSPSYFTKFEGAVKHANEYLPSSRS